MSKRGRPPHADVLTPAEWKVAEQLRHGRSNRAIAASIGVSPDAVKYHVANILAKLGFASRREVQTWDGVDAQSARASGNAGETRMTGRLTQIARTTADIVAARAFYGDKLGLTHLFDAGNMAFYDLGGVRLMVAEDGEAAPESILYLKCDDIGAQQEALEDKGVAFTHAAHKVHSHEDGSEEWMAFFEDNDGRPLALASRVAEG